MPTAGKLYISKDKKKYQCLFIANDSINGELKIVYRELNNLDKIYICNQEYWIGLGVYN